MVRIAPVRLSFNPKTLWFDAGELELSVGDAVVVSTARGKEFGRVDQPVFEMDYEQTKKLNSPLKDVMRLATDDDVERARRVEALSMEALPVFRQLAAELTPDMAPVAVEYLFDSEKAVFYFNSEDRIDFRELVRKLSAELGVRVDMKQIGVRDGARMVGGLGHCGQELCCSRLGGKFNPVSIRMAKEQDLSLNPQKISGCCGRLMCCLRYEFDAYKDFHSRAPKKNARIETPDGEGKVVDLDVPREVISIKVGDEKPVKVPLADMEPPEEGARPKAVGEEAWEKANEPAALPLSGASALFTSELSGDDKLAEPGKVTRRASRKKQGSGSGAQAGGEGSGSGSGSSRRRRRRRGGSGGSKGQGQGLQQKQQGQGQGSGSGSGQRRRRRSTKVTSEGAGAPQKQNKNTQVGRNSSALRGNRDGASGNSGGSGNSGNAGNFGNSGNRRRRRSHKTGPAE